MAELKRSQLGNQSDEQGAFEEGVDAGAINVSGLPEPRESLEVDAVRVEGGVALTPVSQEFFRDLGEIEEGPQDLLMASLVEEPDEVGLQVRKIHGVVVEAREHRFAEISTRSPREQLVWYQNSAEVFGAVLGDRIDVLKDVLESSYSCKSCKGTGKTSDICGLCVGSKYEESGEGIRNPCRACRVLGFGTEIMHSSGLRPCEMCGGSGWKGGVIIPEQAQQEAVTGIVVSIGPDCKLMKIGDRVLHSKYAGHTLKIGENDQIVTMRESEVLKILRQR